MMKRDMDIIRDILLKIEEVKSGIPIKTTDFDGHERDVICYHVELINQAGFLSEYEPFPSLEMNDMTGDWVESKFLFRVGGLTWEGHDFIDKIRDTGIWDKTKDFAAKRGLPLVVETIKPIATSILTEMTTAAIKGLVGGD